MVLVLRKTLELVLCSNHGAAQRLAWARIFSLNLFGGMGTILGAYGFWQGAEGLVAEDNIIVRWSYNEDDLPLNWLPRLRTYLWYYLKHEQQEAVFLSINGEAHILSAEDIGNDLVWYDTCQLVDGGLWLSNWFKDREG